MSQPLRRPRLLSRPSHRHRLPSRPLSQLPHHLPSQPQLPSRRSQPTTTRATRPTLTQDTPERARQQRAPSKTRQATTVRPSIRTSRARTTTLQRATQTSRATSQPISSRRPRHRQPTSQVATMARISPLPPLSRRSHPTSSRRPRHRQPTSQVATRTVTPSLGKPPKGKVRATSSPFAQTSKPQAKPVPAVVRWVQPVVLRVWAYIPHPRFHRPAVTWWSWWRQPVRWWQPPQWGWPRWW